MMSSAKTRVTESMPPTQSRRGFTVAELMIVVAIIAVLIAIVTVSMSRVRLAANRTDTTNTLRQMVAGYNAYMQDHRQRIMPGYLGEATGGDAIHYAQQLRINANRPDGEPFVSNFESDTQPYEDIGSYVWRLAPYLNFNWQAMFSDYGASHTLSRLDDDLVGPNPMYGPASYTPAGDDPAEASVRVASMIPAIGLNSIFLGGDTDHGGSDVVARHPWSDGVVSGTEEKLAATRYTEVLNPAQIIVFAPVGRAATSGEETYITPEWTDHPIGYVELRAPYLNKENGVWLADSRQWAIGRRSEIMRLDSGAYGSGDAAPGAGLPIARWGAGYLPVAHLDGSATVEDVGPLSADMRRWAPRETGTMMPDIEID